MAIIIGIGLALSPIHSTWLTGLVTVDGEVGFFLPAFGTAIWLMGALLYLVWSKQRIDWGDKVIYVPLLIIVGAMGLSGLSADTLADKFAPLGMGVSLFALYLVARVLGKDIFIALVPMAVILTISLVVDGIRYPGEPTGGLITNYAASAGYLIFAVLLNPGRWQWLLLGVASIGLFFIGGLETIFIVGVLAIVVALRKDISRRLVIVVGILLTLIGVWAGLGYLIPLYEGNYNLVALYNVLTGQTALTVDAVEAITTNRWLIIVDSIRNTTILGHGYSLSTVGGGIVHNIPVIIMHQVGPLAAVAWVFIALFCLVKTKWKYAWVAILAMGVWDHFVWTQFAPFFWVLVGVSTASNIKTDRLFNKQEKQVL